MRQSETPEPYIGRFAPSPTGLLHLGSLVAAMASYCDAKKNKGQWLVRIEDLDPPREIKGASEGIISSLNKYGFEFDSDVLYQSSRHDTYNETLNRLKNISATYDCSCSRKTLKNLAIENHLCRTLKQRPDLPYHVKCKVPKQILRFEDKIQGPQSYQLHNCGDFVLKRSDGLFAYQLAVVADDYFQGVTNIVRGIDLIDSTPWQIFLNHLLNYHQPQYAHIPILTNDQNQKLSKQTFAQEIDNNNPLNTLLRAYKFLNQKPFPKAPQTINQFWHHAINHWELNKIAKVHAIKV